MKKISKKDIRTTVESAMGSALEKLSIAAPSKKTKKAIGKVSKEVARFLKEEVKALSRKAKKIKSSSNGKSTKKAEAQLEGANA